MTSDVCRNSIRPVRTTLDIEDDVLFAAKDLARRQRKTVGHVISELARKGLAGGAQPAMREPKAISGLRPLPREGRIVSNDLINKLREEGEY